ncbi:MAG: methyltransferase [Gammaproteobacteria bacterium]|nr:methyltransferase [Gammaproteobacteria bacterium]MDH5303934.1 methyltransferase [Gammaproteobacteria bacterium]MDH5321091.1 methyltransferase [Gammaproteobacteria bacterium]
MKKSLFLSVLVLLLAACSSETGVPADETQANTATAGTAQEIPPAGTSLADVIADQRRNESRARDKWRHPLETLSFIGVEPDMTIVEVLPGNGGWYTQILGPFTAEQGRLIGLTYPQSLWSQMFSDWGEHRYEQFGADVTQFGRYLSVEGVERARPIVGYTIDAIPDEENGQADAVLFIRAMHHLFRFEEPLIDTALSEVFDVLAPGGVVGVVQHRAPEEADAEFANGNNGYLKQSDVIAAFERAGFVLEETSEVNANPNDPADGPVWRLPPSTTDNPETMNIGESDRMTLRFRKPM